MFRFTSWMSGTAWFEQFGDKVRETGLWYGKHAGQKDPEYGGARQEEKRKATEKIVVVTMSVDCVSNGCY